MQRNIGRTLAALALVVIVLPLSVTEARAATPTEATHGMGALRAPATEGATVGPMAAGAAVSPTSVDLSASAPAIGNQGALSSCTAWATGYYGRYWLRHRATGSSPLFAPMFLYSRTSNGVDGGSYFADNFRYLKEQGVTPQSQYPKGNYNYVDQPTSAEIAAAAPYRIDGYATLFVGGNAGSKETLIKSALAQGQPVMLNIPVYPMFQQFVGQDYQGPGADEALLGWHAVWAPAYDATGLWIANSWGTTWGSNGWARLSWAFVNGYAWEAYTMTATSFDTVKDTTAPTFTVAPGQTFTAGTSIGATGASSITASWAATDASGVARYSVQVAVNGTWYDYTSSLASPGATKLQLSGIQPGVTYQVAVAAQDTVGNWTAWTYGAKFSTRLTAENGSGVSYSGKWTRSAWTSANGGYLTVASATTASVTFTFKGRSVAWIGTSATNRGAAKVYLDNVLLGTYNTYSLSTIAARIQVALDRIDPMTTHTLRIVPAGTTSQPAIDVDAFLVMS